MAREKIKLTIKKDFWDNLYNELGRRGNGETESGAFLLSRKGACEIIDCLYYDDIEPGSLDKGYVHLTSLGFRKVWDYCREKDLMVNADIHTHPGSITNQSTIDKENPMIKIAGHIALILPNFAQRPDIDFKEIGIHEFLGNGFNWKRWDFSSGVFSILNQ
jgi:proteasome lid subunit RPN8/RPN11